MSDSVQNYKCPCCGAPIVFDPGRQDLHCSSCGNDYSTETLQQLYDSEQAAGQDSHYDWDSYVPREYELSEESGLAGYSCPSCGAQVTGDANLGATVCPYCGNSTIVPDTFSGNLAPDYLIPFKLDKKAAIEAFEKAYAAAPFLPDEFKDKKKIAEMTGVYVPFWMFDCDCNADITYRAQRVTSWSDSRYNYVKTDHYRLARSGKISFRNIPADASKRADDTYMEAIEPYDYSEAVNFNSAYLSGYLANKYDVSAQERIERANERVKNSTERAFESTTDGFASVSAENTRVDFSNGKIRYALLPVWMLNIKYMGTMYKYAINGQTGKVAGIYPASKKKKIMYFLRKYLIWQAVAAAVLWAYLHLM